MSEEQKLVTTKELVEKVEEITGSTLISFLTRPPGAIDEQSVFLLVDNLENAQPKEKGKLKKFKKLSLFLNSTGGNLDSAKKIADLCRSMSEEFVVIVPVMAKSAATLTAIGADEIVMPFVAELGPIDPIIIDPSNPNTRVPARSIYDFLEAISGKSTEGKLSPEVVAILVNKLDPFIIGAYKTAMDASLSAATEFLMKYQKMEASKAKAIANKLTYESYSHSYAISKDQAEHEYNLRVQKAVSDELATAIKLLYLNYANIMNQNQLVVLSGTRDINRFSTLLPTPGGVNSGAPIRTEL